MNLREALHQHFPYPDFRPGQEDVLAKLRSGQSVLGLMPTGSGKSLLYQFYAKTSSDLVLVVSPLIALMQDQAAKAQALGIETGFVNASVDKAERERRQKRLAEGGYQLFFVTPERFRRPGFFEALTQRKLALFAVDEAHCVSLWGHDFRPDYSKLGEIRARLGNPLTLAVTATATPEVQKDILQSLGLANSAVTISTGLERPELALTVCEAYGIEEKTEALVEILRARQGTTLVYFTLIETLRQVSRRLEKEKVRHDTYHGDLPQDLRRKNLKRFMQDESPLMLATPAFGLGIDRPDVRTLVHMELPGSLEAYFQEVGRAGRDGKRAQGILLFDEDQDVAIQMEFLKWSHPEESFLRTLWSLLEQRKAEVDQGGFDFLREQMSFKNRRDFRVEAGVNILERRGCVERSEDPFPFRAVVEPTPEMGLLEKTPERLKNMNMKLLQVLRWAKGTDECRMRRIYEYFGQQDVKDCGICDVCLGDA